MTTFLRRLSTAAAAATAFIAAALTPAPAAAQNVTPVKNGWLYGTGSLSQSVTSGVTTSGTLTVTTGGFLILNTGGTLSLSAGTITGSPGIIPASLVSGGIGTVTGMTLTLGGALTGSLTNTASVPALTLTLSTFPSASLSGTITNGQLANSSITVGGTSISLGGSASTLTSLTLSSLTVSGLSTAGFVVNNAAGLLSTTNSIPVASVSGAVSQVTSGNSLITVTNTTSTPQVTLTTSPAFNALTATGAVTLSGITTPVASTSYVLQINTVSGVISTTTASAGGGSGVTQVTGTTGRVTVTNTTSTPVVTLPTTLTLSDTNLYLGTLSGTTLLGTNPVVINGNVAFNSASTASTNFGGNLQIGTLSNSTSHGYPGYVQQGYLVGTGMNQFPGGLTGPQDTISAYFKRLYTVLTTSNSQVPILNFGDSKALEIWNNVLPQMRNAIGDAGRGGYDVSVSYSGTATTSTVGWTFNPAGTIETLTATNDAVTYYMNGGNSGYADTIKIYYAQKANGGTFKVQTASASPPLYSFTGAVFSDEAGYTAVSTSGSPTTQVITLTKSPGYAWRVLLIQTVSTSGGTTINYRPAFNSSSVSGVQSYNLGVGGISLSDSNTISTSYLSSFLNSFTGGAPALISFAMAESNPTLGTDLENMKTAWSTSASSTSWLIMGIAPYGVSGVPVNNPTTAVELQNGYLRSFALRNEYSGFSYYDQYSFLRSATWANTIGVSDDIHLSQTSQAYLANKLVRDMGVTAQDVGIYPVGGASGSGSAVPQSVFGPTVTATATTAFTHNTLGSYAPSYWNFRIRNSHDQNYTSNNTIFDLKEKLLLGDGTTITFTISPLVPSATLSGAFGAVSASLSSSTGRFISLNPAGGGSGGLINVTADQFDVAGGGSLERNNGGQFIISSANRGAADASLLFKVASSSGTVNTVMTLSPTMVSMASASLSTIGGKFISLNPNGGGSGGLINITADQFDAAGGGSLERNNSSQLRIQSANRGSADASILMLVASSSGTVNTIMTLTPSGVQVNPAMSTASISGTAATFSGPVTLSGILTPAAATGYVVQINTTSGAITSTTVSAGGSGLTTASAASGLIANLISSTALSYGAVINLSTPAGTLNSASISMPNGATNSFSGGVRSSVLTISDPTGSGTYTTTVLSNSIAIGSGGIFARIAVGPNSGATQALNMQAGSASISWVNGNTDVGAAIYRDASTGLFIASRSLSSATPGLTRFLVMGAAGTDLTIMTLTYAGVGVATPLTVTGTTSAASLSATAATLSGAVTFSSAGITTPAASTGYVVQINTTSGAISTTTASAGGGGGYSTASASSGLVAASVSATTVSYGSYIFHGITSSASPALNTATLSLAAGSTFTTSGSSVQISSSNSASVLTVSGSPTLSGSGTITYSALPFLAANQTFSGANTFSGTVSLSTLSGTVSLAGQFDGTNGIRIQSTGSTANVLTLKSATQSAARTLTLSIDASATVSVASLLYTNQTQNATLGTVTASSFTTSGTVTAGNVNAPSGTITASNLSVTTISAVGGTVYFPLTTIDTSDLSVSQSIYAPNLSSGGGSGDVVYFDTGTGQLTHDSAPSDPRTKDNIAPLGLGLAELRKLADAQGDIAFNYKPGFNSQPDLRRGGFNARTLADVSPLLAHDRGTLNGVEHVLEPEERAVQAMTVRAVAELSAQVAALRAVVYALIAIIFTYAFILLSSRKNRS